MKKNCLFSVFLFLVTAAPAQESNLKEDYSAYLPEIRSINKLLSQLPHTGTVLTKEGLQGARNVMNNFATEKTVLRPILKSIKK